MEERNYYFSIVGKILSGFMIIFIIFTLFRNLMMLLNPELIKDQLNSLNLPSSLKDIERYRSILPIELIRNLISLVGLVLIILSNKNGPFIYLGSEMMSALLMFIRGDILNGLTTLALPLVIILVLLLIPYESERDFLNYFKREK